MSGAAEGITTLSITRLVEMYGCELTAEEFYAEIDRRASLMIEAEIRAERRKPKTFWRFGPRGWKS